MPRSSTLPVIVLAALCLLAGFHALMYWSWLEDDAFISYRYARNLVDGHGLVYNQDERVEGYSNFSWVLAAAVGMKAGLDPADLTRWLGVGGAMIAGLLSWLLTRLLCPGRRWLPLAAPLILAVSPAWVRHATNGLETTWAALLLLALVLLVRPGGSRGSWLAGAAAAAVLALTRPEGGFMAALVLAAATLADRRGSAPGDRRAPWALFLACWGVYWSLRGLWFGSLMPNTYHAKMTGTAGGLVDGMQYVACFLRDGGVILLVVLALAALLTRRDRWPLLPALAGTLGSLAFAVAAGGDWMVHSRFCAAAMPLLAVLATAGAADLLVLAPTRGGRRSVATALAAVALLNWIGVADVERAVWREITPAVAAHGHRVEVYRAAGQWLSRHAPPNTLVAASDIGALGYWSQLPVLDMFGLVDRHVARCAGKQHHKADAAYILDCKPGFVVLIRDSADPDSHGRIPDRQLARHPDFAAAYAERHVLPLQHYGEEMVIYQRRPDAP